MIALTAYQAGQLTMVGILVIIGIGLVRNFTRKDRTLREKTGGKRKAD